jgi:hypothetical protein
MLLAMCRVGASPCNRGSRRRQGRGQSPGACCVIRGGGRGRRNGGRPGFKRRRRGPTVGLRVRCRERHVGGDVGSEEILSRCRCWREESARRSSKAVGIWVAGNFSHFLVEAEVILGGGDRGICVGSSNPVEPKAVSLLYMRTPRQCVSRPRENGVVDTERRATAPPWVRVRYRGAEQRWWLRAAESAAFGRERRLCRIAGSRSLS